MDKINFKQNIWLVLFIIVCLLFVINYQKQSKLLKSVNNLRQDVNLKEVEKVTTLIEKIDLPVPIGSPSVGATYIHYFFTGKVKEIKPFLDGGVELVLESENLKLPKILVSPTTSVQKISSQNPRYPVNMKLSDIKVGLQIDASMEFDPVLKNWIMFNIILKN